MSIQKQGLSFKGVKKFVALKVLKVNLEETRVGLIRLITDLKDPFLLADMLEKIRYEPSRPFENEPGITKRPVNNDYLNPESLYQETKGNLEELIQDINDLSKGEGDLEALKAALLQDIKTFGSPSPDQKFVLLRNYNFAANELLSSPSLKWVTEELKVPRQFIKGLRKVRKLYAELGKFLVNGYKSLKKLSEEQGKIVILYHATTRLPQILSKGFLKKAPKNVPGLGTTHTGYVSFTYRPQMAKELAEDTRTKARLELGSLSARDLYLFIKKQGPKLEELLREQMILRGVLAFKPGEPCDEGAFTVRLDKEIWKGQCFQSLKDIMKIRDGRKLSRLYDYVIWSLKQMGKGHHFGAAMGNLSRIPIKNIGVVAAKVDLNHPDVRYLGVEREFAVPIDAIVEVLGKVPLTK